MQHNKNSQNLTQVFNMETLSDNPKNFILLEWALLGDNLVKGYIHIVNVTLLDSFHDRSSRSCSLLETSKNVANSKRITNITIECYHIWFY